MMITNKTTKLMGNEVKQSKHASIVVGVVTEEGRQIEAILQNQSNNEPIGDLIFEIGSTTKTFTSLLLAKLVTDGKISLDDPVSKYQPQYKNALSFNGKEVTFRHLATHSSRLPREDMKTIRKQLKEDKERRNNPYKNFTHKHLDHFLSNYRLNKEIGKKWLYSNIGVGLLANTLAEIVDLPYEEAIQKYILQPLHMTDTFITLPDSEDDRYVMAFDKKGNRIPPIELPAIEGAGAFKSTVNDMLTYLEHQIGLRENLLTDSIELTHQNQHIKIFKRMEMALGWMIDNKKDIPYPIINHGGTTVGFHTYCGFIKEKKIGVVVFSTVQLSISRLLKMIVGLEDIVNTNIARSIFEHHIKK